jgi:Fe2+ transport system protein FeoA
LLLLSEAETGKRYRVSGIYERDRHLLEFLEARGIRPGTELGLAERNYDKTLSIRTSTSTMVLGRPAAEKIWVSRLPSRPV